MSGRLCPFGFVKLTSRLWLGAQSTRLVSLISTCFAAQILWGTDFPYFQTDLREGRRFGKAQHCLKWARLGHLTVLLR